MGVEYERWLIAKGAAFLPAAASIVKFIERLRKEGWIIDPKSPAEIRCRSQRRLRK